MFHLYFGAFDIVLYLGATYFSLVLANAICDDRERPVVSQSESTNVATEHPTAVVVVPQKSKPKQTVTVSVKG